MAKLRFKMSEMSRSAFEAGRLALSAPVYLSDSHGIDTHVLISAQEYKTMFTSSLRCMSMGERQRNVP